MTAPAALGPLPPELVAVVLLALPWLERVRAEGVAKGWLALLRAAPDNARVSTAVALAACRAAGLPLRAEDEEDSGVEDEDWEDEEEAAPRPVRIVCRALALRASGTLHTLAAASSYQLKKMVPSLSRAQSLKELHVHDVKVSALCKALDALAGGSGARCRVDATRVLLAAADVQDQLAPGDSFVRRLLARAAVPHHGALSLRLGDDFLRGTDEQDDFDDARVRRMLALGNALALSSWPAVTLELKELADELDEDSSALATLLEVCLAGMTGDEDAAASVLAAQEAQPARGFLLDMRLCNGTLTARDAARVTRAAPPWAKLRLCCITCNSADDCTALLGALRREGCIVGAEVCFSPPAFLDVAVAKRLLDAMAVAELPCDFHFFTSFHDGDAAEAAYTNVCNLLRGREHLVGIRLQDVDQRVTTLLPSILSPALRFLHLSGRGVTNEVVAAVAAAIMAGKLPALRLLMLRDGEPWTAENARCLGAAVQAHNCATAPNAPRLQIVCGAALEALPALIETADIESSAPLEAVRTLVHAMYAAWQNKTDLPMLEKVRGIARCCIVELAPKIYSIIAHDTVMDAAASEQDEEIVHMISDFSAYGCGAMVSETAQLLLLCAELVPHEATTTAQLPACHMLLLAARVQRVRSFNTNQTDRYFTPLLHRALLSWARDDTISKPVDVLSAVAAACRRDSTVIDHGELEVGKEARVAVMSMLLACGMPANAPTGSPPALTNAGEWLAGRSDWLLRMLADMVDAALGTSGAVHPLTQLPGLMAAHTITLCDAALHLAAMSRVPALAAALPDAPSFTRCIQRLLMAPWMKGEDATATKVAFSALAAILSSVSGSELHYLAVCWSLGDSAQLAAGHAQLMSNASIVLVAVRATQSAMQVRVAGQHSTDKLALAAACSDAAAVLRILETDVLVPSRDSVQHASALAMLLRRTQVGDDQNAGIAQQAAKQLHATLLQWARAGPPPSATPALLSGVAAACEPHLPEAPERTPRSVLPLVALLACALAGRAAVSTSSAAARVAAWLALHAGWLFGELVAMQADKPPTPTQLTSMAASTTTALHLCAASQVPAVVDTFTVCDGFAVAAAALLRATWAQPCEVDRSGVVAAATAYTALAKIVLAAPPDAMMRLAGVWRAAETAQKAQLAALPPLQALHSSSCAGARGTIYHLGCELARLRGMCDPTRRSADRCEQQQALHDAADAAATHLSVVLRALRPAASNFLVDEALGLGSLRL